MAERSPMDLPEKIAYVLMMVLPMAVIMLAALALAFWLHWLLGLLFFVFVWFWVWTSFYDEIIADLRGQTNLRK